MRKMGLTISANVDDLFGCCYSNTGVKNNEYLNMMNFSNGFQCKIIENKTKTFFQNEGHKMADFMLVF